MNPREHALFRRYPLDGRVTLSTGPAPTPYQVYAGHGVFIGGTARLDAVRELLAPEQVQAVQTEDGHALMAVWAFDFSDASLGPHHELQVSLFVSNDAVAPVPAHRLALLELMLTRPEVRMLCHGLWNTTPQVVAYNRELLALDARRSNSRIREERQAMAFEVDDASTNSRVVEGRVHRPRRASLQANLALIWRLGLARLGQVTRQPWLATPILNPVGAVLPRNAVAQSFTKAERSALRYFDAARDRLTLRDPRYAALQFQPQFFQAMGGFKFVYLAPH